MACLVVSLFEKHSIYEIYCEQQDINVFSIILPYLLMEYDLLLNKDQGPTQECDS